MITGSNNENVRYAQLMFRINSVIKIKRYDAKSSEQSEYYYRAGPDTYINLESKEIISTYELASRGNLKDAQPATKNEVQNKMTVSDTLNMKRKQVIIDTETAIDASKDALKAKQIFQIGTKEIGTEEKAKSLLNQDVFEDFAKYKQRHKAHLHDPLNKDPLITSGDKVRQIYEDAYKHIKGDTKNIREFVKHGFTKDGVEHKFARFSKPDQFQKGFNNLTAKMGKPDDIDYWAFNAKFDQTVIDTLSDVRKLSERSDVSIYPIKDIRAYNLMQMSQVFPEVGQSILSNMSFLENSALKKLNMNKHVQDVITESFRKGFGSRYTKGSSVESYTNLYATVLGHDDSVIKQMRKLTGALGHEKWITEAHTAGKDAALEELLMRATHKVDDLVKRTNTGQLNAAEIRKLPVKERLGIGIMRDAYIRAHMSDKSSPYYSPKGAKKYFANQQKLATVWDEAIDLKSMDRAFSSMLEYDSSTKISKNILDDSMRAINGKGGTVGHLLAGALLATGMQSAMLALQTRLMKHGEEPPEGMGHNSILTVINRLRHTDFGSTYTGMLTRAPTFIKKLFTALKAEGIGTATKGALTAANTFLKNTLGKKDMLKAVAMGPKSAVYDKAIRELSDTAHTAAKEVAKNIVTFSDKFGGGLSTKATESLEGFFQKFAIDITAGMAKTYGLTQKMASVRTSKRESLKILANIKHTFVKPGRNWKGIDRLTPISKMAIGGAALSVGMTIMAGHPSNSLEADKETDNNKTLNPQKARRHASLAQRFKDIRQSSYTDGIRYGGDQRMANRASFTDFRSGLTKSPPPQRSSNAVAKVAVHSTVQSIGGKVSPTRVEKGVGTLTTAPARSGTRTTATRTKQYATKISSEGIPSALFASTQRLAARNRTSNVSASAEYTLAKANDVRDKKIDRMMKIKKRGSRRFITTSKTKANSLVDKFWASPRKHRFPYINMPPLKEGTHPIPSQYLRGGKDIRITPRINLKVEKSLTTTGRRTPPIDMPNLPDNMFDAAISKIVPKHVLGAAKASRTIYPREESMHTFPKYSHRVRPPESTIQHMRSYKKEPIVVPDRGFDTNKGMEFYGQDTVEPSIYPKRVDYTDEIVRPPDLNAQKMRVNRELTDTVLQRHSAVQPFIRRAQKSIGDQTNLNMLGWHEQSGASSHGSRVVRSNLRMKQGMGVVRNAAV